MVMPANNSSSIVHYWAGKYPNKIGWLVGPSAIPKTKLREWMPFALDNDAFSAWTNQTEWKEALWLEMLLKVKKTKLNPLWVLVPDVVAFKEGTLEKWAKYSPAVKAMGFPLGFAVQDGMTPADVPRDADIVFVGGSTDWKWRSVQTWTRNFPRVHVGRVNQIEKLWLCEAIGVESVDGTGWFRESGDGRKIISLKNWLEGFQNPQLEMHL